MYAIDSGPDKQRCAIMLIIEQRTGERISQVGMTTLTDGLRYGTRILQDGIPAPAASGRKSA